MNPIPSSPLADPVLDFFRDASPPALDPYRTYFVAKLTARTSVGGVWNYDWTEQTFDRVTGSPSAANPARSGGIVSGAPVSPAVEVNNNEVLVGAGRPPVYVFLRQKGIVNGQVYYEFEYLPYSSSWKAPVRLATTVSTPLSTLHAGTAIDGVALTTGDRVLLVGQGAANGIYVAPASGTATRAFDADTQAGLLGAVVAVEEGAGLHDTIWMCTADAPITVDTTLLPWIRIPTASEQGTTKHVVRWSDPNSIGNSFAKLDDDGKLYLYDTASVAADTPYGLYTPGGFEVHPEGTLAADYPSGGVSHTGRGGGVYLFDAVNGGQGATLISLPATGRVFTGYDKTWFAEPTVVSRMFIACTGGTTFFPLSEYTQYWQHKLVDYSGLSGGTQAYFTFEDGTATHPLGLAIADSNGTKTGYTGPLAPGQHVYGGIIYDAGSGAFAGTGSANNFTAPQSFTAGAAQVPVTVKGAVAQSANLTEWQDSGGAVLASVAANGTISAPAVATSGAVTAASFSGDGSGLTNLSAEAGVAIAALAASFAYLN